MKKLLVVGIGAFVLTAMAGVAQAGDMPAKQEGRVWIDQNFVLAFSPQWSLTTMPGGRVEFARSREGKAGVQFLELFFGPNFTQKWGNFTLKASLWYYYMGYPQRGRMKEQPPYDGVLDCSTAAIGSSTYCTSTYNFSHNIEVIPAGEYRIGRFSIYDRIILHNTFYADVYSTAAPGVSVGDQRWGFGTVLRELLQVRYAVTDRLGVSMADEVFLGINEDGDTSGLRNAKGAAIGYNPLGYWKNGFRYNRTYLGFDYKVAPNFTIAPMYMVEVGVSPTDSADVTDIAHNLFVVATVSASIFTPTK